jgi:hypothetical protein
MPLSINHAGRARRDDPSAGLELVRRSTEGTPPSAGPEHAEDGDASVDHAEGAGASAPQSLYADATTYSFSSAASDGPTRASMRVPSSRCSSRSTSPSLWIRETSPPSA